MADPTYAASTSWYGNLTSDQQQRYNQLNQNFRAQLGADYDPEKAAGRGDAGWSDLMEHRMGRDSGREAVKRASMLEMQNFFQDVTRQNARRQALDTAVNEGYEQSQEQVGKRTDAALERGEITKQSQEAALARQTEQATLGAQEALAGTGMRKSGAATGAFVGIQQERMGLAQNILTNAAKYETEVWTADANARFELDKNRWSMAYDAELREQGWEQEEANYAKSLAESLLELQIASIEPETSWFDRAIGTASGLFQAGVGVARMIGGDPTGVANVLSGVGTLGDTWAN